MAALRPVHGALALLVACEAPSQPAPKGATGPVEGSGDGAADGVDTGTPALENCSASPT